MDKKDRKLLEEKIILAVSETVKNNSLQTTPTFLKSVKKHSKAIAKKLMKELDAVVKKAASAKAKKVSSVKTTAPKKGKVVANKKVVAKVKK